MCELNMEKIIVQKIKAPVKDAYSSAKMYFSLIGVVNGLPLTARDVEILAHLAVNGTVLTPSVRDEFCNVYKTTSATVNNITSKLRKLHLLEKVGTKVVLNPVFCINFGMNISMDIRLAYVS